MGNRSKEMASGMPTEKHQEPVFDAAFSRLMDNFSSTRLFSPSAVAVSGVKPSAERLGEDDIVSPLKHLHLRQPINSKRTPRKLRRKGKTFNDLNLSVAAGFVHRPVVWPARLKSSAASTASKILRPARLSVLDSSLSGCNKETVEKTDVEKVLNKDVLAALQENTALDLKDVSSVQGKLSGRLPKSEKGAVRVFGITEGACASKNQAQTFLSLSEHCPSKESGKGQKSALACHSSDGFLKFRSTSQHFPVCSPSPVERGFSQSDNPAPGGSQTQDGVHIRGLNSAPSQLQSAASSSGTEGALVTRSCSHEMRLEETNVNELASYFEDLLHIPRKMSTMAEMMYA
ncbi:uncharacterized protein LOC101857738 [Aplysia californica]|uniref:Oxidative stress-responsive serine-rich protein 1 n=1 Tax=Aplysia californica TaxID=6500 RepID=A0ABM0JZ22_APLCA|nr:uncharacterized protein LOC101857738 [Aplysia californica]